MTYSSYISTTGADLEKEIKWAWATFVNKGVSLRNSQIKPVHSPLEWNQGQCWECDYPVSKTATGCPQCHMSFID